MQKVRRYFINIKFRLLVELLIHLFHLLTTNISLFPSQYYSLSLNLLYLALEDGSPIFRQVFSHRTFNLLCYSYPKR